MSTSVPSLAPEEIEQKYVHETYELIAARFSKTRTQIWSSVQRFLDSLPPYTVVADIGCGNGKNFDLKGGKSYVGLDITHEFLVEASQRGRCCEAVRGSALQLPFRSNTFDAVISIAVLHHFASEERRFKMLQELIRILAPGGHVLVTVWALEQTKKEHRRFNKQENMVSWVMLTKGLPPEKAPVKYRYYHVYHEGELLMQCLKLKNINVRYQYYERGNWGIILQKNRLMIKD